MKIILTVIIFLKQFLCGNHKLIGVVNYAETTYFKEASILE